MKGKIYESEEEYWNDSEIVSFFSKCPPPEYWVEFFDGIENKKNIKVLDMGCGGGRNTLFLLKKGFDVSSCDLHVEMVKETRRRVKDLLPSCEVQDKIIQGNMLDLPYEDGEFDIILSNGIFHNVSCKNEFEIAINEASRVLKKNGLICLNMFTADIVDDSLIESGSESIYITLNNIDMMLIHSEEIMDKLREYSIEPFADIKKYNREVFTGERSVLRGIFIKR